MKSFEFFSNYQKKPIVYVDMDGVLADFFGEVAREHDVDYWREIHRKDLGIDQVAQDPGFFSNLPRMPNAGKFMRGLLKINEKYSILSSPLLSDVSRSSEEKTEWLGKHLRDHQPQSIIYDHEKYKYAVQTNGTPNILIDDWETNIKLWEANGGIGILYKDQDYQDALQKVQAALHGKIRPRTPNLAILGSNQELDETMNAGHLYTNKEVLNYVTGIHDEYHMPKPILKHKTWILKHIPISELSTPEYMHQDDPYRRVIDINWDHVSKIQAQDIKNKPVVVDDDGWVLDGNHRVMAARAAGFERIPALIPYTK